MSHEQLKSKVLIQRLRMNNRKQFLFSFLCLYSRGLMLLNESIKGFLGPGCMLSRPGPEANSLCIVCVFVYVYMSTQMCAFGGASSRCYCSRRSPFVCLAPLCLLLEPQHVDFTMVPL